MEINDIQKLVDYIKEDIKDIKYTDIYQKCGILEDILKDHYHILWFSDEDLKKRDEIKKEHYESIWKLVGEFQSRLEYYKLKLSNMSYTINIDEEE